MKKTLMVLFLLAAFLFGCQHHSTESNTWGNRHNLSSSDISTIKIQETSGLQAILPEEEITGFLNVVSSGVFNQGQLDIRPPDYVAEVRLIGGDTRNLSLWLDEGTNLFTDGGNGHYTLTDGKAEAELRRMLLAVSNQQGRK